MAKATHYGTCQICGRKHKLPGGVLSKHGYTLEFGFFNGTCNGSGHLPFEQSIDLIEGAIISAKAYAEKTFAEAEAYRTNPSAEGIRREVYIRKPGRYSSSTSEWIEDSISFRTKEYEDGGGYIVGEWDTQPEHATSYTEKRAGSYSHDTEAEIIAYERAKWARVLTRRAEEAYSYAEWQTKRINGWEPSDLEEI
jgi:hypothetical protein